MSERTPSISVSRGQTHAGDGVADVMGLLYALEAAGVLSLFALYRLSAKAEPLASLLTVWGGLLIASVVSGAFLMWFVVRRCYQSQRAGSRAWMFGVASNVLVVSLLVLTTEVALRYLVVLKSYDEELGGFTLLPRQWRKVTAAYDAVLTKAESQPTYLVPDPTLGWTIAPSRKSENGMYLSSVEGLRSAEQGVSMKAEAATCRIALIGDSFTFGETVPYADTWGGILGSRLGGRCQILNFGVIGYGTDQVYLRYLKDVRPWHPDMVIFSFIDDDFRRAMSVYGFLTFPDGRFPFTKPRFILKGDEPELLLPPLASPREPFESASIHHLPGINYDVGYLPFEWDRAGWEWLARSYILRFLVSVYPLHELERPEVSLRETLKLNGILIAKLRQSILADGAKPLIVFFPQRQYLERKALEGIGTQVLQREKLPYIDVAGCMHRSVHADLFNPDGHFSTHGNLRAADCLADDVKAALQPAVTR
mgnify:CR=1 FL=1